MLDYNDIEKKWQKAWDDAKVFEPEISDKESMLVVFAFAYVNSPLHAGHMKTYSLTDVYARYMRLRGLNVLLPTGFHMTGTPILGIAKRIAEGEQGLINDFRTLYHILDSEIAKMKDPLYVASYFAENAERSMKRAGLGIDWRRKFNTIDPRFSKFIEWQFLRLKEKGYLVQGTHPVGWCPNEKNAVGQHDTKGDVQPKIEEIVAIKFKDAEGDVFFPCATYRPETIYGVTNIFVNEALPYVVAKVGSARFYMAKEAAGMLGEQFEITIESELQGKDLLAKKVINPVTKETVPVLHGSFVEGSFGTGIVMSVPAHAPFDYVALEKLKKEGKIGQLPYKKVIAQNRPAKNGEEPFDDTDVPAKKYLVLSSGGIDSPEDIIEQATKNIYGDEAHWGIMLEGAYKGRKEPEARDGLKKDLVKSDDAMDFYAITNDEPVVCRCNYNIIVKVVKDQWFINYGDQKWKEEVRKTLPNLKVIPDKFTPTVAQLVEWIDLRAAERAQGLGTPFPFNPSHIIESLSDSTIYPIFYTFINIIEAGKLKPEQLTPEFFDYVINAKGSADAVSKSTGIDVAIIQKCKDAFEYWYRNTSNHSATELLPNHFVMYIFNHVAMLRPEYYAKQIVPNGLLLYEGQKMSKSIGNTIPILEEIEKHGADPIRFSSVATAELASETNFELDTINSIKQKNEFLLYAIDKLNEMKGIELEHIDYWLYSKLNSKIETATKAMDIIEFKGAYTDIYYNSVSELKWYMERGGHNQLAVRDFLQAVTVMLAPIMPHFAEEMWHRLGNTTLVAKERWPTQSPDMINKEAEMVESIISGTVDDVVNAVALTSKIDANRGKKLRALQIIIASDWKRGAYNALIEKGGIGAVMGMEELKGIDRERLSKFLSQFMPKLKTLKRLPEISSDDLYVAFIGATDYLKKRFATEVTVEKEAESKSARAARATLDKPSIDIVWG